MRIAICFSGMIRTGVYSANNIKMFLGDYINHCDFFLHTWIEQTFRSPRLSFEKSEHVPMYHKLASEDLAFITESFDFKSVAINSESALKFPRNNFHPLWISWVESIKLKIAHEKRNNFVYDYVVKLRPDIIFRPGLQLSSLIDLVKEKNFVVASKFINSNETWEVDDVFFVSKSTVMDLAILAVNQNPVLAANHEEMYRFLVANDIEIVNSNYNYWHDFSYAILRPECLQYDPILDYSRCEECDKRIHFTFNVTTNYLTEHEISELYRRVGYIK